MSPSPEAARTSGGADPTPTPIESITLWWHTHMAWLHRGVGFLAPLAAALACCGIMTGVAELAYRPAAAYVGRHDHAQALALAVGGLAVSPLALAALAWAARSWRRFRAWPGAAPFRVEGWRALADVTKLDETRNWCPCRVEVVLDEGPHGRAEGYRDNPAAGALEAEQAVAEALAAFVARANARYAQLDADGEPPRVRWTADGTSASGSANALVVLDLYRLGAGALTEIAQRTGRVRRVTITPGRYELLTRPETD